MEDNKNIEIGETNNREIEKEK